MNYNQSFYNYFINYNDRVILFNGISGSIFSVNNNEFKTVIQKSLSDITYTHDNQPDLFNFLLKHHFIYDSNINEYEIIKLRNTKSIFINQLYRLVLIPTLNCNFNCWYCYENHNSDVMSPEIIESVKKHIFSIVTENRVPSILLDWYGGEPLLCFENIIEPIAEYCNNLCTKHNVDFSQLITTNGYLIDKYIEQLKKFKLTKFQITLDGIEKKHNKVRNINGEGTFNKIINNIILLCDNIEDVHITLRINYDNNTLNGSISKILDLIPEKHRNKITPDLQRVWQTHNNKKNQKDNVINLRDHWINLKYNKGKSSNSFSLFCSHKCYVDRYYHTEINYDGKVFKCTARDFSEEQSAGIIQKDGTIKWKNGFIEKMYSKPTFENRMCIKCKHLPICAGPCSQKIRETSENELESICDLNFSEISVEEFIIQLYKEKEYKIHQLE